MRRQQRRGVAAMEFTFWLPVLAAVASGIVDTGWYMSQYHNVSRAARDGARQGATMLETADAVPGTEIEAASEAQALSVLEGVGLPCEGGCAIDADWVIGERDYVVVDVIYPFEPLIGFIPIELSMRSTFSMVTRQQHESLPSS